MAVFSNNPYVNWLPDNLNSNAKVSFLNGQLGTSQGNQSFIASPNTLPINQPSQASKIYQSPLTQASTLASKLPESVQTNSQLVRTFLEPSQSLKTGTQPAETIPNKITPSQTTSIQQASLTNPTSTGMTSIMTGQGQVFQIPQAGTQAPLLLNFSGQNGGPQLVSQPNGWGFPGQPLINAASCTGNPGGPIVWRNASPLQPGVPSQPVPKYLSPNIMGGWNQAMDVLKNRLPESDYLKMTQWPKVSHPEVIKYPTVAQDDAGAKVMGVEKQDVDKQKVEELKGEKQELDKQGVDKPKASRNDDLIQENIRETRIYGAILTILGSLTVGLGIAGIILYDIGKSANSGYSWCYDAHAMNNTVGLTQAISPSGPGIHYVTSGAGILGILTFIVGVMVIHLKKIYGTLADAAMYTSFVTLAGLVLMAILSILSFIMTFRKNGPPTCVALSVISGLVIFMAVIPFILLFVIYCRMRRVFSAASGGHTGFTPLRKISVIQVGATASGETVTHEVYAYECCPCCVQSNGCCRPRVHHKDKNVVEVEKKDGNQNSGTDPSAALPPTHAATPTYVLPPCMMPSGCKGPSFVRYPFANSQYLWGNVTPYGIYGKPAATPQNFTPYNFKVVN